MYNTLAMVIKWQQSSWQKQQEVCRLCTCTLIKKKRKFSYIYKEIQNGAVAKSYMTKGLLIYGEILAHFLIK
jgi:hypothetical protein